MSEQAEIPDIKKKVISTGIRVGTNVKTKFMRQFINQASPEGLYMLDIDQTLARIKTSATVSYTHLTLPTTPYV